MKNVARLVVSIVAIMFVAVTHVPHVQAETGFSNMSSAGFRLVNGGMSSLGGPVSSTDNNLLATNMYPYQQGMTLSDYMQYFNKAVTDLGSSKAFRDGLILVSVPPSDTGIGRLIKYPKDNYETVPGLLDGLAGAEASLINSRDIFAYGTFLGVTGAKEQLLDCIKTLANIYLMIGDEFFIDAVEFRFSPSAIGLDQKLDEQICLLGYGKSNPTECVSANASQHGAQYYYEKAVQSFVYGFQPAAIGKNIYISDYFDDTAVLSLFNLASERLSSALREKSSKQFIYHMLPDPSQEWLAARQKAIQTIKDSSTGTYLVAAAAADNAVKKGGDFSVNGGDTLVTTLTALSKQGRIISDSNLNPLGYDKRHVPMYPLEDLLPLVQDDITAAVSAQGQFDSATREMDQDVNAMRQELNSLTGSYITRLNELTGCAAPILDDPLSVKDFEICVVQAGGDLLTCDVKKSLAEFNTCMSTVTTTQALKAKYQNIMNSKLRLDLARLNRQNILDQIGLEKNLNQNLIKLKRSSADQQYVLLDSYYNLLKEVRIETDTETKTTTKTWDKKKDKWVDEEKNKVNTTTEGFYLNSAELRITTNKEKDLLAATTEYQILVDNAELETRIKNLLLNEAEAEIEVQIAAQQKNVVVADFDDAIAQKEYYWTLFNRSLTQIQNYYTNRIPTERILKSQAAIDLSTALNRAAHSAYLAAKALEYKYVSPIENQNIPGGKISMSDLFKAQTPADLQAFLGGLVKLNVLECPFGNPSKQINAISVARDILGVKSTATITEKQKAMKDFLDRHMLSDGVEFSFTISSSNTFLPNQGMANVKIWGGNPPATCNDFADSNNPPRGVTVIVDTTQIADNFPPLFKLSLSGHSTLTDKLGIIRDYIPAYSYEFMLNPENENPTMVSEELYAYVNSSYIFPPSIGGGWTNKFKARGMASPGWTLKLRDPTRLFDFKGGQIKDIYIHIDTISQ